MSTHHRLSQALSIVVILIMLLSSFQLPVASAQGNDGLKRELNPQTGRVSFLSPESGRALSASELGIAAFAGPESPGMALAKLFAPEFGLNDPTRDLTELKTNRSEDGRLAVRYQQTYQGIPVLGGELVVNTNENGDFYSINGEISPDLPLSAQPALDADQARQTALESAAKWYEKTPEDFLASDPELWIYDESLLQPSTRAAELVWRMEVTTVDDSLPVRELVLVNAERGQVSLHFNQIDTAWRGSQNGLPVSNTTKHLTSSSESAPAKATTSGPAPLLGSPMVSTYTAGNGTTLPGTLVCTQADPNCTDGDAHAKAAHKYAIGTYNLYATQHGRDSINNAGMTIISSVHYLSGYANASWNGMQMRYGDAYGFPLADDVVAHELTHGVTQYESNVFYYYQSGAINESFSDLWGEYYDQTNGLGNDTAGVKWQMGEDVAGMGALRSMSNPPAFSNPDKMSSTYYYEGAADNGGVHTNSGVNNKAVFLMVDGGTFNGRTVTALGWDKTAAIYYRANTNLLTSGADYSDLYYALQQACSNLIGQKGITTGDCAEVKDALDAVEMNGQPAPNFNTDASYCSPYETITTVFSDNLESGTGNWTFNNGANLRWQYDSPYGSYAHSGSHFLYANDYPDVVTDATARLVSVSIPSRAYLHFAHAYDFEASNQYYDGGVLEYSINGGSSWLDAGSLIDFNGYKGMISNGYSNPLKGRSAFIGASHGYISTRVNLASLSGNNVMFRWRMGLDEYGYVWGWWVDDVEIYQCQDITPPLVSSIRRASGNPTSATKVYFTVNFSEPVNGVDQSDFQLNVAGGISGASIENVTGSGAAYSVMVNTGSGPGTLRLDVRGTATISDLVGHPLGNAPFTGGETYTLNSGDRYDATVTRMGDFNGDGRSEIAVFRPTTSTWHIYGVGDFMYGTVGDIPVVADYNGDGRDDIAVFRPTTSTWHIYGIGDFVYGTVGDIPVIADYNGDGKDDIAVFRPTTSTWHIYGVGDFVYGTVGDIPVVADYNGDGKADIAVFRPTTSTWHLYGVGDFVYGTVGDIPVVADYNGDRKADIAVFRPTTSTWHLYGVGDFVYGTVGDIPVVADYNGDRRADIAVFRPTTSTWHLYGVGDFIYGTVGDIPV